MALTNFEVYQRDLYIKANAIRGVGANQTLRELQAQGWGLKRQEFLNTYREYAGIPKKADAAKYTPRKFFVSRDLYTPAKGFISDNYRYTLKHETVNPITGESFTRYTRIVSEHQMTYGAIMDEGLLIASEVGYWGQEEVTTTSLYEANYSEEAEW